MFSDCVIIYNYWFLNSEPSVECQWVSETHSGLLTLTGILGGVSLLGFFFFLQFWWLIQCWYSACIFISLLSICIPFQSRKPVTSGDIANQPRPWYIYDSQPQPSCPAVLSTILSLSAGSQDSLLDFGLPLTDKTARLLIACKTRSTADHTPTQTRAPTHTPARSLLTQAHDLPPPPI